ALGCHPADPAVPAGAAKGEGEKRLSVQYTAGQECPDNVFFPSTRPPHLEELHNQAQQGLKSLQHQGRCPQLQGGLGDTVEGLSPAPGCAGDTGDTGDTQAKAPTHQLDPPTPLAGSTFRPHDSFPKSSERAGKKRKERRTTVLGIPQHVHKELGLRNSHGAKGHPEPLLNGGQVSGDAIRIPTIDGKLQPLPAAGGARVCLGVLEEADAALQKHINKVYYDDSLLGRKTAAKLSPMVRPKSLAVPGMTTYCADAEPLQPRVVQPGLGALPVPLLGARPRSREPSSSSDNWSHSQSTETIVSNSSTISSQGGCDHRQPEAGPHGEPAAGLAPTAPGLLGVGSGRASPAYSTSSQAEGSDTASLASERSSARSVSLRKMKKPPAPPRRTYSLHQKADGEPKVLGLPPRPERRPQRESSAPWSPRPEPFSPTGEDEVFSPPQAQAKWSCPDGSDRTMSPSSGYSSQSGTPTLPTKGLGPPAVSPGKSQPQKPDRVCSLQSPALSVSSSLTSISSSASDPTPPEVLTTRSDRFIIPPHPKVPAPFSPPPTKPQQPPAPAGPLQPSQTPQRPALPARSPRPSPAANPHRHHRRLPTTRLPRRPRRWRGAPRPAASPPPTPPGPRHRRQPPRNTTCPWQTSPLRMNPISAACPMPPRPRRTGRRQHRARRLHLHHLSSKSHPPGLHSLHTPPSPFPQPPCRRHHRRLSRRPRLWPCRPKSALRRRPTAPGRRPRRSRCRGARAARRPRRTPACPSSPPRCCRWCGCAPSAWSPRPGPEPGLGPGLRSVRPLRSRSGAPCPTGSRLLPKMRCLPSSSTTPFTSRPPPWPRQRPRRSRRAAERPSPGPEGPAGDGQLSPRSKSPASTASFIFAKSSRKLVIETASSPEAQADLKRNLVAELMNFSGQRSAAQSQRKPGKIPPPVAKKPSLGSGPAPSPKAPGQRRWAPRCWTGMPRWRRAGLRASWRGRRAGTERSHRLRASLHKVRGVGATG
uniref:Uncharacterized protein n=1 Tax=Geospiza parvula TaxID=87175 RepID=A0A8U8C0J9_GEOPR